MSLLTIKLIATTIAIIELERKHNQLVRPQTLLNTYDYIVVGSGASGAVVAARLAEDYSKTVLLLEAGGPQNATSDAPALYYVVWNNKESEWDYPMVRQKYAYFGYTAGMRPVPRAKSFGGCTVHNGMNYYRDSIEYWDIWNDTFGIKNWTFRDVLPYFLKSENNLDKRLVREEPQYHRSGGLYSISTANPPDIMLRRYVESSIKHGSKWVHPDGRGGFGITIMQRSIRDGIRQSTATAFLESDIKPNLQTFGFSVVTQVLFNENKRAIGVKFRRFNVWHTVYARNEVILSAGSIGSPQLLLLSGVGPKEHLNTLGIPVISDVSVGSYMSYDLDIQVLYDIIDQTEFEPPEQTLNNLYDLYVHRTGRLGYIATGLQTFSEVAFRLNPRVYNGFNLFDNVYIANSSQRASGYKLRKEWEDYYRPYQGHTTFPFAPGITRVMSNGTIRLNSTNPFAYPLIDPCVYCNRQDLEDVIKTFQLTLPFYENSEIRKYIRPFRNPIPGCTPCADEYYCYSYIKCMAQTYTGALYIVGTCRMGCDTDPNAVVDNRFRVRGVDRLRVIDTSVIPVDGTQETSWGVMLGERGAHFVEQDSKLYSK